MLLVETCFKLLVSHLGHGVKLKVKASTDDTFFYEQPSPKAGVSKLKMLRGPN